MSKFLEATRSVMAATPRNHWDMAERPWADYCSSAERFRLITDDEVEDMISRGDEWTVMLHNMRLVAYFVRRSCISRVPIMETVAAAEDGFMAGVRGYNKSRGTLSTYIVPWMMAKVNIHHDKQLTIMHVSSQVMNDKRVVDGGGESRRMGAGDIEKARQALAGRVSLDDTSPDDEDDIERGVEFIDDFEDRVIVSSTAQKIITEYFPLLSPGELEALLAHMNGETITKIAESHGLARETIALRRRRAVKKIKDAMYRDEVKNARRRGGAEPVYHKGP